MLINFFISNLARLVSLSVHPPIIPAPSATGQIYRPSGSQVVTVLGTGPSCRPKQTRDGEPSHNKLARKLLAAFDEIRETRDRVHSIELANDPGAFIGGVPGVGQYVLLAGVCLVQAMLADRNFEWRFMGCLTMMVELDADFVQKVGVQLRKRPT